MLFLFLSLFSLTTFLELISFLAKPLSSYKNKFEEDDFEGVKLETKL